MREALLRLLLWAIRKVETRKNNRLAYHLHRMADQYDTRPTGGWNA